MWHGNCLQMNMYVWQMKWFKVVSCHLILFEDNPCNMNNWLEMNVFVVYTRRSFCTWRRPRATWRASRWQSWGSTTRVTVGWTPARLPSYPTTARTRSGWNPGNRISQQGLWGKGLGSLPVVRKVPGSNPVSGGKIYQVWLSLFSGMRKTKMNISNTCVARNQNINL